MVRADWQQSLKQACLGESAHPHTPTEKTSLSKASATTIAKSRAAGLAATHKSMVSASLGGRRPSDIRSAADHHGGSVPENALIALRVTRARVRPCAP